MIDFSKYKRVFTFGCSFTHYQFPTWADLIAREMSHAEYYNFGTSGAGNPLIGNRIAQANSQFNFNDTDLVMIMFTTAYREDRYIDGMWKTKGNVYTQDYYDKDFIKKYCDPDGYVIRDMGIIELIKGYTKNLPCNTIYLSMNDLMGESRDLRPTHHPNTLSFEARMNQLFPNTLEGILPSVISVMGPPKGYRWKNYNGDSYYEGHPSTGVYCDYLLKVGIPLSDTTIQFARDCHNKIENIQYVEELHTMFPELQKDHLRDAKMI